MNNKLNLVSHNGIVSNQYGIHEKLDPVVLRHLDEVFRKPLAQHTLDVFKKLESELQPVFSFAGKTSIIFDSCCGTGHSTRLIAQRYPQSIVIGIDRSAHRLGKQYNLRLPGNVRLLQADCVDFWRLANQAGWHLEKHFLLYPNPYPKSIHLKRRWHAHPVFPDLISLAGDLVLRSNWRIYLEEFDRACELAGTKGEGIYPVDTGETMTLFEKKYRTSGYELYETVIHLNQ